MARIRVWESAGFVRIVSGSGAGRVWLSVPMREAMGGGLEWEAVAVATFGGVAVEDACSRALKSGEVVVVDVPWDARWTVTGMRLAVGLQRCSGCLWRCSILVGRAELS